LGVRVGLLKLSSEALLIGRRIASGALFFFPAIAAASGALALQRTMPRDGQSTLLCERLAYRAFRFVSGARPTVWQI
jgi:hypothetical protein